MNILRYVTRYVTSDDDPALPAQGLERLFVEGSAKGVSLAGSVSRVKMQWMSISLIIIE
jgi:hypothetical protein